MRRMMRFEGRQWTDQFWKAISEIQIESLLDMMTDVFFKTRLEESLLFRNRVDELRYKKEVTNDL
jgi:hypothetical protein